MGVGEMKDVDGNRNTQVKLCFGILGENDVCFYVRRSRWPSCGWAARGKMLGESPRANKCWSMSFFPAMIASWQGEDVQHARVSGSLWGIGSMIDPPDSSRPASRTWSNN